MKKAKRIRSSTTQAKAGPPVSSESSEHRRPARSRLELVLALLSLGLFLVVGLLSLRRVPADVLYDAELRAGGVAAWSPSNFARGSRGKTASDTEAAEIRTRKFRVSSARVGFKVVVAGSEGTPSMSEMLMEKMKLRRTPRKTSLRANSLLLESPGSMVLTFRTAEISSVGGDARSGIRFTFRREESEEEEVTSQRSQERPHRMQLNVGGLHGQAFRASVVEGSGTSRLLLGHFEIPLPIFGEKGSIVDVANPSLSIDVGPDPTLASDPFGKDSIDLVTNIAEPLLEPEYPEITVSSTFQKAGFHQLAQSVVTLPGKVIPIPATNDLRMDCEAERLCVLQIKSDRVRASGRLVLLALESGRKWQDLLPRASDSWPGLAKASWVSGLLTLLASLFRRFWARG